MKMKMKTSHFMNFVDLPNAKKQKLSQVIFTNRLLNEVVIHKAFTNNNQTHTNHEQL